MLIESGNVSSDISASLLLGIEAYFFRVSNRKTWPLFLFVSFVFSNYTLHHLILETGCPCSWYPRWVMERMQYPWCTDEVPGGFWSMCIFFSAGRGTIWLKGEYKKWYDNSGCHTIVSGYRDGLEIVLIYWAGFLSHTLHASRTNTRYVGSVSIHWTFCRVFPLQWSWIACHGSRALADVVITIFTVTMLLRKRSRRHFHRCGHFYTQA